jgi:hypothetical protein
MANLAGFEVLTTVIMKSSIFWGITPCSSSKVNDMKLCLPPAFALVSCSACSSTLKMEAKYSSEKLVDFQRITQNYNPRRYNSSLLPSGSVKGGEFLTSWATISSWRRTLLHGARSTCNRTDDWYWNTLHLSTERSLASRFYMKRRSVTYATARFTCRSGTATYNTEM